MAGRADRKPEKALTPAPSGPADAASAARGIGALIKRVEGGDKAALPLLREALLSIDDRALLGAATTCPERWAGNEVIRGITGEGKAGVAAMRRHVELFERDLAGERPSALEMVLVRRASIAWLIACGADAALGEARMAKDLDLRVKEFRAREAERASRRLVSAIKALALVRRRAMPILLPFVLPAPKPREVAESAGGTS